MKTMWICGLVVGACVGVSAWAVKEGDSRQAVIAELGIPIGEIQRGDEGILYYERGTVHLRTGVVVNADLISAEQAREQREAAERTRVLASPAPQPVQPVVYVQPAPQPQVVYVQQPAPPQVVYIVQQEQPPVVYDSQPAPVVYSPEPGYIFPYYYGIYPRGYYAGAGRSYLPTRNGGSVYYGGVRTGGRGSYLR